MNMELLYKFDKLLETELKRVVEKGEIQPNEWMNLKALACIMKDVKEVERMLSTWDDSDENDMYSYKNYNMPRMRSMYNPYENQNGDFSNMRGRSKTTGRYMSRTYGGGRSGHSIKDRMVDSLERMYDDASTEHEKQILDDWIRQIESSER